MEDLCCLGCRAGDDAELSLGVRIPQCCAVPFMGQHLSVLPIG